MISDAFCEHYGIGLSQDSTGRWWLSYTPPLVPWVVLYAARQLGEFPFLKAMGSSE